ncbi:hypothetical protein MMC11_009158 [Xylographa trunciseda]|nr:hypothetical protein [Xylographa trunciseda]
MRISPSQSEPPAAKRKRTEGSAPVQALPKSTLPQEVFLVRLDDEGQDDNQPRQEILGVYVSVEKANAVAYDYWEQYYGWIDEDPRGVEEGAKPPDGADFLYKGIQKDGSRHILSVDEIGTRTEVVVECMPLQ